MARKSRVDKASERAFATLCSDAGVYCQLVTEDETGWDCLVEFPPDGHVGPAEAQPGGKRAYVQIKSRVQPKRQTEITLSNARKMAQDPEPWFIVLFHKARAGQMEICAKHIWSELIIASLKRIRLADIEGTKLHRRRMAITFDDDDLHSDDLCEWTEQTIDGIGKDYQERKRELFERSGYEDGFGTGTFTVRTNSRDEIADAFLGLGDGIEIADFKLVRQRFGIPAQRPEWEMPAGRLTITPLAQETCAVRLRHSTSGESITLDGTFVHNGLGVFTPELAKARLQAGFLDATFSPDASYNLSIRADMQKPFPLSYWRDYAKTLIWLDEGQASFEVWFKGRRVFESRVFEPKDGHPAWLPDLVEMAAGLKQISGRDHEFSLEDLLKSSKPARILTAVSFAPSVAFQYPIVENFPDDFDQALYYALAGVGSHVFCSMVARPVIGSRLEGQNERRLIMGQAKLLDHYATADSLVDQRKVLEARFDHLIDKIGNRVLGLGDIENVRSDRELTVRIGHREEEKVA